MPRLSAFPFVFIRVPFVVKKFDVITTDLKTTIDSLGLEKFKRHIFLCADPTEPKC